ncbi:MAG TPA: glycosyltransferase family A protein [Microbacteriaceae bacterium]|nr:glycosyltransferase family A protein [Microbacteriaceae bacterium]
MTRVSVVIPAYQNAMTIAETIRSILEQEDADIELIVADHSSTDGTLAVVEPFIEDARVTLISTPAGGGAARNWQRVTEAATGEFVKLVPGDDLLRPGAIAAQAAALAADPEAVLVAGRRDILDARGEILLGGRGLGPLVGRHDGRAAIRATVRAGTNLFGEPGAVMMRRGALAAAGGWDGRHAYLIDQASYARVLLTGSMIGLDRVVSAFRVNAGQWSIALSRHQAEQVIEFHHAFAAEHPGILTSSDLRTGDRKARVAALARRAFYKIHRRRLILPTDREG